MGYVYVILTIAFTIYGQVVMKWQMSQVGELPPGGGEKIAFLLGLMLHPWVFSVYVAAFAAALAWQAALSKFPLSVAYPFMSLSFVGVMFLSAVMFHEAITLPKVLGMTLIVLGLAVGVQKW